MKKLSVIVIGYNIEKFLKKCLESLVMQTYKNLEIIFIDDGSNDDTLLLAKEFSKNNKNIYIYSQKNSGPGSARNLGIQKSTGEYITFVDGDDFLEKETYEVVMKKIEEDKGDLCIFGYKKVFSEKSYKIGINPKFYFKSNIKEEIISKNDESSIFVWNKVYNKEIIIKNNIYFLAQKYFEDNSFIYRYLFFVKRISVIEKGYFYNYIQREGSLTKEFDNKIIEQKENTIEFMKEFYKKNKIKDLELRMKDLELRYNIYIYRKYLKILKIKFDNNIVEVEKKLKKTSISYLALKSKIPLKHKLYILLIKIKRRKK